MSTLKEALDKAKSKAVEEGFELVEEQGPELVDDLLEKGREEAAGLPVAHQEDAKKALDEVEKIRTPLLRLTNITLMEILGHWQDGEEAEARRRYLEHDATFQERRAAMHAAGDQLVDTQDAKLAAWEEVKAGLQKVGEIGLKVIGNALIRMTGIPGLPTL